MSQGNLVGRTISGYSMQALVGEGGTAVVYRAEHPDHGIVAFKVLREKFRQEKTAVARFTREAEFGRRVTHPNVIRTFDVGTAEDLHFLAIEWASGELLEKYAKRSAPLSPPEVARIITQIGAAVKAAHDAGIIHRDLKPDNAMYDPVTGVVKVLDFGIAAATDTRQDERLTRAGYFVGTLMYVAPEALSGELVTPAADQYSLATIAYFLLTGALPYSAKSPREMFTQLLSQPPTPLSKARPNLSFPSRVEEVVMRGLDRLPASRYPDISAFAAALDAALTGPTRAPAPQDATTADPPEEGGSILSRVRGLFKKS